MSDWHTEHNKGQYDFTKAVTASFRSYAEANADVVAESLDKPRVSAIEAVAWWLLAVEDEIPGTRISGKSRQMSARMDSATTFWKGETDKYEPYRQNREIIYRILYWLSIDENRSSFARDAERDIFEETGSFEAEFGVRVPLNREEAEQLSNELSLRKKGLRRKQVGILQATENTQSEDLDSEPSPVSGSISATPTSQATLKARIASWARHPRTSKPALSIFGGFASIIAIIWAVNWIDQRTKGAEEIRQAEAHSRIQSELKDAWRDLLKKAGGNTGKASALEFILAHTGKLREVDLSCRAIGFYEGGVCQSAPLFLFDGEGYYEWNDEFKHPYDPEIIGVDFSGAILDGFDFRGSLDQPILKNTVGRNWSIRDAILSFEKAEDFTGFSCSACRFVDVGYMPWQFLFLISGGEVSRSVVHFPEDAEIRTSDGVTRLVSNGLGVEAVVPDGILGPSIGLPYEKQDWLRPPLFLRAPKGAAFPGGHQSQLRPLSAEFYSPAENFVFWDFYATQDICFSARDIRNFSIPMTQELQDRLSASYDVDREGPYGSACGFDIRDDEFKRFFQALLRKHYGTMSFYAGFGGPELYVSYSCHTKFDVREEDSSAPLECLGSGGASASRPTYVAEIGWPELDGASISEISGRLTPVQRSLE